MNALHLPHMDTKSNDDSGGSDSLDKSMQRKCVMVETSSTMSEEPAAETDNCSRDSAALHEEQPPPGEPITDASSGAGESSQTFKSNSNNNTTTAAAAASAAFETKVKLISQNLKETTLAETDTSEANVDTTDNNNTTNEATDKQDCDHRVKRVRFHPDVKPNDGGNRVKKKKRCSHKTEGDATTNQSCDGMEMDDGDDDGDVDVENDEDEQEEEFNLAKTIAEAEDYLKQHPLTFVRRVQQNGDETGGGGLKHKHNMRMANTMDHEMVDKHDSDKDFYKKCKPENGIERILGKETKAGKASTFSYMTLLDLNNPTHFSGGVFIALRESRWALLGVC